MSHWFSVQFATMFLSTGWPTIQYSRPSVIERSEFKADASSYSPLLRQITNLFLFALFLTSVAKYVRSVFLWFIMQRIIVFPYRHFRTTLKMGPIFCPETSVRNYFYTLHNQIASVFFYTLRWNLSRGVMLSPCCIPRSSGCDAGSLNVWFPKSEDNVVFSS